MATEVLTSTDAALAAYRAPPRVHDARLERRWCRGARDRRHSRRVRCAGRLRIGLIDRGRRFDGRRLAVDGTDARRERIAMRFIGAAFMLLAATSRRRRSMCSFAQGNGASRGNKRRQRCCSLTRTKSVSSCRLVLASATGIAWCSGRCTTTRGFQHDDATDDKAHADREGGVPEQA
jgi:hypothetical protein